MSEIGKMHEKIVKVSFAVFFFVFKAFDTDMECQIAAKLLSHVTIGVSNNLILRYKKAIPRPSQHTFCSTRLFTFQASFVVIWRTLCNLQWIA